jgi:CheY-like chemotaxis protein
MDRRQSLRVLIESAHTGQQKSFNHILATNIQCWGYEAVIVPSAVNVHGRVQRQNSGRVAVGGVGMEVEGDVLVYDLDESFRLSTLMAKESFDNPEPLPEDDMRLTIALSSRSVSRMALEQIGAVALLHKPFEMGYLQRYLRVLQRLLFEEVQPQFPRHADGNKYRRVLVVDDDVEVAHAVCQCLVDESGYEVAVAYDGLKALEQYLTWQPDCIVTDLIMPSMNGYQFMRCLAVAEQRSTYPMPAFVVISALTQLEFPVNRSYLRDKVVVYVDKPFHIEHLLAAVEQALGTFKLQDDKRVPIRGAPTDPKRN